LIDFEPVKRFENRSGVSELGARQCLQIHV